MPYAPLPFQALMKWSTDQPDVTYLSMSPHLTGFGGQRGETVAQMNVRLDVMLLYMKSPNTWKLQDEV